MSVAYIFPGQGSQYPNMGKEYFDLFSIYRECIEEAQDILKISFEKIFFQLSPEELNLTKNSQLALFVNSIGIYRVIQQQFPNFTPTTFAGLSLGEYSALAAAGFLSFEDALRLVEKRGFFMGQACQQKPGKMLAVIGFDQELLEKMITQGPYENTVWIANLNCPGQVVLSGLSESIENLANTLKEKGAKKCVILDTEGAFHSKLMLPAQERLAEFILDAHFELQKNEIIMNVTASSPSSLNELKNNLIHQVSTTTYWEKSIRYMQNNGITHFVEVGAGKVLTGINRRVDKALTSINLDQPQALEALADLHHVI